MGEHARHLSIGKVSTGTQRPDWALHFKDKQLEKVQGRTVETITDLDNITSEERMGLVGLRKKSQGQRDAVIAFNCV